MDSNYVHDLPSALEAYWNAHSRREEQAAYHEILLYGGRDGYSDHGKFRMWLVRSIRKLALWVDGTQT